MSNTSHQIKLGAMISYLALGISIASSLLYFPWMVSKIGKSNYALYTLASSFITIFLFDFGLSSSVQRFVAKYNAEGQTEKINEVVSTTTRLYLIIDGALLAVLTVLYFFLGQIYTGLTEEEITIFRQLYIIVAISSIISFPFIPLSGILNAYELFIQQKSAELFHRLFSTALTVVALLNGGDVRSLVIAHAISSFITIGIKICFVKRRTTVRPGIRRFNRTVFSEVAQFSIWITIMSLAQRCVFNLAPSILGIVSNSEEIALFAPASALEGYFYSLSAAVNGLFLATISRYITRNEEEKIYNLTVRVGRYQFLVLGLVFIEFLCVGHDFMIQWMGKDFVGVWPCTIILLFPEVMIYSQQIADTTVIVKNKVKKQAIGYIIMAGSCIGLSFLLSRLTGALGACIAIAAAYTILFVYMNILYYKDLHINVFGFYRECYLKLGIPMTGVAIAGYILCSKVLQASGWSGIMIKGSIVLLIYIGVMSCFLDQREKDMIRRMIRRGKPSGKDTET